MMNARKSWVRWRPFLGVLAVGVCAFSLTLQGAPPKETATGAQSVPLGAVIGDSDATGLNPGGPMKVLPPSSADYRKVPTIEYTSAKGAVAIGAVPALSTDGVAAAVCTSNEQCSDCNPCTLDVCDVVLGTCTNPPRSNGTLINGCWDGFDCNGREECIAGACVTGIDAPDCLDACDEDSAIPGRPCTNNTQCDGGSCIAVTGWVCDEVSDRCVDVSAGPCTTDGDCDDGNVNTDDACETATGICRYSDNTIEVRCCDGTQTCSRKSLAACRDAGGDYLAVTDACRNIGSGDNPIFDDCPDYAAGITPQGVFTAEVGPVSNLACDSMSDVGDDYETKDHAALVANDEAFMTIELLRFAGRVVSEFGARWVITFYDENGIFVEDVFWPDGQDDQFDPVFEIKTVDFDPPLVIPTKGFVTFSVQGSFSPGGRVMLRGTSPVDVGVQDVANMWVNGGTAADVLAAVDDTLAFEMVGTLTTKPEGACCNNNTANCSVQLPWVCKDNGDHYQGDGRACRICQDGPNQFGNCVTNTECNNVCDDNSVNAGEACVDNTQCIGGDCDQTGGYVCVDLPTCINQACCNADGVDGKCVEAPECSGNGGVPQGFGTTCEPNCCTQTLVTGADECNAIGLQVIPVPAVGAPPVTVTITGNNSSATFDDGIICDVWGPTPANGERGWWEGFTIDSCADVRIDLCCTDINGEPLRPAWGNLVSGCNPCGNLLGNAGVPPPVGLGIGTTGFARGGPFCGEDNLWGTFGPLPAGAYYYPIYTVPDGTSGVPPGATYQLHFTVAACRVAACCTGDSCTDGTELDCDALGGRFLAPPNVETAIANCSSTPCATGSCCQGPGACLDVVLGQPMTKADCDALPGDYVGYSKCDAPTSPCPICTVRDASCYPFSGGFRKITDESWVNTLGRKPVHAEDFVAQGTEITQVCFEGDFFTSDGDLCLCSGTPETDCTPSVVLEGHITIELWSYDNFFPGVLIASSEVGSGSGAVAGEIHYQPTGVWGADGGFDWSLTLDDPLPTVDGTSYFLATRWNTDQPLGNDCSFWQFDTEQDCDNCNNYGFWNLTGIFNQHNTDDADWSLCLDYPIVAPAAPTGACCEGCGLTCTAGMSQTDCLAIPDAKWYLGEACDGFTCPSAAPANDACASATVITDGVVKYTTVCASSDGPTDNGLCAADGVNSFTGNNIWYEYHTGTCDGTLQIGNCEIGNYDSLINIYRGPTEFLCDEASDNTGTACPNGDVDCPNGACEEVGTGACPACPSDNSELKACNDDGCKIGGGGSTLNVSAVRNTCYLISVGGWALNPSDPTATPENSGAANADVGFADLAVTCGSSCVAPAALSLTADGGAGGPNPVGTRGFGFVGGTVGELEAVRVLFASGPNTGLAMWVQPPVLTNEASGGGSPPDPNPANNFQWSTLGCTPFYAQWNGAYPDGVYVKSDQLTPNAHILVQVVSEGPCLADEDNFSIPLDLLLSNWGDLVGCAGPDCTIPPDGANTFDDISAIVDKFKNVPGAVKKWRADVDPALPNGKIDFTDIPLVVDGFRGLPYPFAIPLDPCAP